MNIELLERAESGEYEAIVSVDGDMCELTRRFGSWTTVPDASGRMRGVLPAYAGILQSAVRSMER